MAWECSDCPEKERGNSKIPVCHHCGKPVCKEHREMIADDAFSMTQDDFANRVAVHCLDCRKVFHPRSSNIEPDLTDVRGLTVA
jgi:hypothetical protein